MKERKLIIIMRNERLWNNIKFEGEWESLRDYPNKILLKGLNRLEKK